MSLWISINPTLYFLQALKQSNFISTISTNSENVYKYFKCFDIVPALTQFELGFFSKCVFFKPVVTTVVVSHFFFFCWTGRLINKIVWINIRFVEIFLERNYKEDFKGINMCCALHTYKQNKRHIIIDTKIKHTNNPSCNCTNLRFSCKIWKPELILNHFL